MIDNNQNIKTKNPVWFKILNLGFMLPVIIWPLIFFSTIFFFDNPKSFITTLFIFLLVNAYPLYLLGLLLLNARLFRKRKIIATILPIAFGATFLFFALKFVGGFDNLRKIKAQIKENKQAPIDKHQLCCGFTKDSNNIYYYDKPLKNVDIKSFEIINFNWAKDTNVVYYNGNPISYIDKKSFQYLDYHYSIDAKNVYYDTVIISGADAITFKHIEGTQDGKDKNNCYRYGKQVDCKVLLTEE